MTTEIEEHFADIDGTLEKLRKQLSETITHLLTVVRDLAPGASNYAEYEENIVSLIGELVSLEHKIRRLL